MLGQRQQHIRLLSQGATQPDAVLPKVEGNEGNPQTIYRTHSSVSSVESPVTLPGQQEEILGPELAKASGHPNSEGQQRAGVYQRGGYARQNAGSHSVKSQVSGH